MEARTNQALREMRTALIEHERARARLNALTEEVQQDIAAIVQAGATVVARNKTLRNNGFTGVIKIHAPNSKKAVRLLDYARTVQPNWCIVL